MLAGHFSLERDGVSGPEGLDGPHQQPAPFVKCPEGEGVLQHLIDVGHGGGAGIDQSAENILPSKFFVGVDVAVAGVPGQAKVILSVMISWLS